MLTKTDTDMFVLFQLIFFLQLRPRYVYYVADMSPVSI